MRGCVVGGGEEGVGEGWGWGVAALACVCGCCVQGLAFGVIRACIIASKHIYGVVLDTVN